MNDLLQKPRTVYVSRTIEFNAAHRLFDPSATEEENLATYGKCSNHNGHGHNYRLNITIRGTVDRKSGFLFDLKELKNILKEEIMERFDHKHLNHDVPELRDCVPTTEVLAVLIWDILEERLRTLNNPEIALHEVHLHETGKNAVRYFGE